MLATLTSLRGAALFTAIRIAGAGSGFVTQLILARVLSARDLGLFFSATSLAAVAGLVAAQGYPEVATRFMARYRSREGSCLAGAFIGQASADAARAAAVFAAAIAAAALAWPSLPDDARITFVAAAGAVLAIASANVCAALAGAMRRFGLCYLPEALIRPVVFLSIVAGLALFGADLSAGLVTGIFTAVTVVVLGAQCVIVRRTLPAGASRRARRGVSQRWRAEARPLVLFALFTTLFADIGILFVTPFLPSADVAVFGLCLKLALLVGFVVQVTQHMALPDLADARLSRNATAMRAIVRRAMVLPVVAILLAVAVSAAAGDQLLAVFGAEFRRGQDALTILLGSQLLRALAGPNAHLLTLAGAQRVNAALCAGALTVLTAGNAVLTPLLGITGAALAVFVTYLFWTAGAALALNRLGEARTDMMVLWPAG